MQAPTLLLIVGMHRSGTSSVAGLYTYLGCDIGRSIMPPAQDNPKGFFENQRIVDIHDRLLLAFGRTWDVDLDLPDGWLEMPETQAAQAELTNVLREEFDPANPVWLVKDPRLCLILDLWRAVGDALGRAIKCVVVVRHPDEIAASLERREGMPFPVVIALQGFYWRSLKKQALIAGAGGLNYNELLTHKADALGYLNKASGLLFQKASPDQFSEAAEFFTEKLVTHTATGARSPIGTIYMEDIAPSGPLLTPETVEKFITRAAGLPDVSYPETDELIRSRNAYINRLRFSSSRLNLELMRTQAAYARLQNETDSVKTHAETLDQRLQEIGAGFHADVMTLKSRAAILEGKLSRSEEKRQAAETAERRAEAKLQTLEQETTALRQEYQRIASQATAMQERISADARSPFRASFKHLVWGSARVGYRALPMSDRQKQALLSRYGSRISGYMPGAAQPAPRIDNIETAPIQEPQAATQDIRFPLVDTPDVSIIVPVYNQLGYTVRCLQSLATHETSRSFEVILMDDVSSDATSEVLPQI